MTYPNMARSDKLGPPALFGGIFMGCAVKERIPADANLGGLSKDHLLCRSSYTLSRYADTCVTTPEK